ncbi:MAG: sigma-70 family RNA polymerase sigma factor [Tannerella sp.]|jgi:RNA polymerase sigma-70 factor (ECF subfamily)|nr:sigma-70 family RNA polymerase sigma factor [Tannerella sp.]
MNADEFKQRFYPFHSKLYRIAYALLNNVDDAEDILQDTYFKLWNKRNELIAIRQPEAFCVAIVRNLCMDFLKSPKSRTANDVTEIIKIASDTTPESDLESKEKMKHIETLINKLPEKQQLVIRMRGSGDCTLEEIEIVTGESAANVRVLLSRARRTLRDMLTDKQVMKTDL